MPLINLTDKQIKRIINVCEDNIANCCYEEGLEYARQEIEEAMKSLSYPVNGEIVEKIEESKVYPRGTETYTNVDVAYNRGLDKSEKLIKEY